MLRTYLDKKMWRNKALDEDSALRGKRQAALLDANRRERAIRIAGTTAP
jgi:hypothetical protein